MRLPAAVHGHEEIRVDPEDVAGQRLMPRPHAADGTCSGHAVAARREKPAVQRFGKDPADRPDLETASVLVDVRGHQRRAGSSLAAKKADAVAKISFARRNCAFSARSFFSSAIASSADCLVSSATVASDWLRQRRSDSGAIPRSFATAAIAFVSDEYEDRDSASSLTAFALNSGVYRAPFAMVPSPPIESEEIRNKNQFISHLMMSIVRLTFSTGLKYTDQVTLNFLSQLNQINKPITVIFYGDHLPGIYLKEEQDPDDSVLLHEADYFIWSNDAPPSANAKLDDFEAAFSSSNYFMSPAAEHMNEKVSPYLTLLTKLHEEIPAISRVISNRGGIGLGTATYLQSDGTVTDSTSMSKTQKQLLADYKLVQYDQTSGKNYLKESDFMSVD